ncbi:MAG: response regulator [Acidobacteriota bacterium]|nr:response regulator [Acidobacteriota bacterium]
MQSSARHRVLCVDDDEDACEMLSVLLKYSNMEARCVESAEEAWELIRVDNFDLYLLDSWLPGIDGFELCRQIRAVDQYTPILFYSAAAYHADKQKGIEAGANDYLTKPEVDILLRTITSLVDRAANVLGHCNAEWRRDALSGKFTFGKDEAGSNKSSPSLEA